jgi:poly(A) polymerase
LLFRYGSGESGTIEKKAHIYTREEHGIDAKHVDADALWVVRNLRRAGFTAYVVGGAVRDLIVDRTPKDFDVATAAQPQQIRRLFRSARIIGRRFRLVHVYFGAEKYIEVSTFRSRSAVGIAEHAVHHERNNLFGTMEEDAARRDFTVNALYYDPIEGQVIDYVGGVVDLRQHRLRTLVPAMTSFAEDPVRMIRAVKYATLMGFPIPLSMAGLIRRARESILSCSRERVTEEVFKILTSGSALGILELAHRLHLFEIIFPSLAESLRESRKKLSEHLLGERLRDLDLRTNQGSALGRSEMFSFLFSDLLRGQKDILEDADPGLSLQQYLRGASAPLFPSKKDLAVAVDAVLRELRPHRRGHSPTSPHGEMRQERRAGRVGEAGRAGPLSPPPTLPWGTSCSR